MLSKLDVYQILFEMKAQNIQGAEENIKLISKSVEVPLDVIRYINDNRSLQITEFYEDLRRKSNTKASKLYKNLMKEDKQPQEVLKTASSYVTQVLIRAEQLDLQERTIFYDNSRVKQISEGIHNYFNNGEIRSLLDVLTTVRKDIKILENKPIN